MSEKISIRNKIAYGLGGGAETIMANLIVILAMPIYNIGLGIDAGLIGLALSIPKIWDAFSDPLMGNISDNFHSRWGRRKPFIFVGAILSGIFCMIMWSPIEAGSTGIVIFFTIVSILMYTSYTVFFVPFNALGFELSEDYNERTSVMSYKTFFATLVGSVVLSGALKMCYLSVWEGDIRAGARFVGIVYGTMMIVMGIMPAIFCKERVQTRIVQSEKIGFLSAVKITLKNKPFLLVCGIIFTMLVGVYLVLPLNTYVLIYYVCKGDMSFFGTLQVVGGIVGGMSIFFIVPAVNYLGVRLGKKKALGIGITICIISYLLSWFYYTPDYPYLCILGSLTFSFGATSVWIFTYSLTADVCDVDELDTGLRREGMYSAVYSWLMKLSVAVVMSLSGFVIKFAGFEPDLVTQTPQTLLFGRLTLLILPGIFLLVALFCVIKLPLTKESFEITQQKLKEMRQKNVELNTASLN